MCREVGAEEREGKEWRGRRVAQSGVRRHPEVRRRGRKGRGVTPRLALRKGVSIPLHSGWLSLPDATRTRPPPPRVPPAGSGAPTGRHAPLAPLDRRQGAGRGSHCPPLSAPTTLRLVFCFRGLGQIPLPLPLEVLIPGSCQRGGSSNIPGRAKLSVPIFQRFSSDQSKHVFLCKFPGMTLSGVPV